MLIHWPSSVIDADAEDDDYLDLQMALSIRKAAVVAVYSSQYKKCFEEIKHIVRTNLKFYLTHKREKGETGSKRSRSR